jgi:hypothetical protein
MKRKFVDFQARLKASAQLRAMQAAALPVGGVHLDANRPHVAGSNIFLQVAEAPPNAPVNRFPPGSFMVGIVESWPDRPGDAPVFLWIGPRGYATAREAVEAGLPEYTTRLASRRA